MAILFAWRITAKRALPALSDVAVRYRPANLPFRLPIRPPPVHPSICRTAHRLSADTPTRHSSLTIRQPPIHPAICRTAHQPRCRSTNLPIRHPVYPTARLFQHTHTSTQPPICSIALPPRLSTSAHSQPVYRLSIIPCTLPSAHLLIHQNAHLAHLPTRTTAHPHPPNRPHAHYPTHPSVQPPIRSPSHLPTRPSTKRPIRPLTNPSNAYPPNCPQDHPPLRRLALPPNRPPAHLPTLPSVQSPSAHTLARLSVYLPIRPLAHPLTNPPTHSITLFPVRSPAHRPSAVPPFVIRPVNRHHIFAFEDARQQFTTNKSNILSGRCDPRQPTTNCRPYAHRTGQRARPRLSATPFDIRPFAAPPTIYLVIRTRIYLAG